MPNLTYEDKDFKGIIEARACDFHKRKWPNLSAIQQKVINCIGLKTTLIEELSEGPYFSPKLYSLDIPLLGNS